MQLHRLACRNFEVLVYCYNLTTSVYVRAPLSDTSRQPQSDAGKKLNSPDPEPETKGASKVGEEGSEGEGRDVGFGDGHQ